MSKINILDKNTIDKIAAGEVIDRPSSIVKEMLENAIDAKSTAITVEIKDGGISLIRITDNGSGIEKDDVRNAFLRHATSKIKNVEDLLSASSLGFRGEALSSIAAVTQMECITKTLSELTGVRYVIEGGVEKTIEEIGAPAGTTFIIRNLFYNTPARRKFLKTPQTEASYINSIMEKIALSHPEVSIRFISNNQNKLHTSGNGKVKDIIYSVYGRDISANLLEINDKMTDMHLTGYIGKPIISRGNKNNMIYFINGRYIKSKIINSAIEEAYKPYMMQHNYPFCVLHFNIDSSLIDVNVHPSKMEIRFEKQMDIYNLFYSAISSALKQKELIPDALIVESPKKSEATKTNINSTERPPEPFEVKRYTFSKVEEKEFFNEEKEFSKKAPVQENIISKEFNYDNTILTDSEKSAVKEFVLEEPKQLDLFDNRFLSSKERIKHKMIGQLFDTYWLIEYDNNLYIIDQHAAHEKVLFENTMASLKNKEITSQMINPPIILTLSMEEELLLNKFKDNFSQLGYEIEHYGGRDYAVRAVPANLYSIGDKELLINIIDSLDDNSTTLKSELITEKIASMSCKAAVKGNNKLSVAEADALIEQLLSLENPYNCPHGRPTIISMSKYEIEKKFKRII
jgi:DNA mismatch repair protein MutL